MATVDFRASWRMTDLSRGAGLRQRYLVLAAPTPNGQILQRYRIVGDRHESVTVKWGTS